MDYKDLLKSYIEKSGLSLREVEEKMREKGFSTNKAYISKLQNGVQPPAGEDITRALAEVTGGDIDALLLAGYIEKAPDEIKSILAEASTTGHLFNFFKALIDYLESYRKTGEKNESYLEYIDVLNDEFSKKYHYWLNTSPLKEYPEYAVELIARLKRQFIPLTESLFFGGMEIVFSKFVNNQGNPIFEENPYPEMIRLAEEYGLKEMQDMIKADAKIKEETGYTGGIRSIESVLKEATQKKIEFFEKLEDELDLNLADPEVQKKLKKAAKIIFSSED